MPKPLAGVSGRVVVCVVLALCELWSCSLASAGALRISQVMDGSPDLYVFFKETEQQVNPSKEVRRLDAAFGSQSIPVKGIKALRTFDPAVGIVLAIDVSASLNKANFKEIQSAAKTFVGALPKGSQVALASVGTGYQLVAGFTGDLGFIAKKIDSLLANDQETALYESILKAQQLAQASQKGLALRRAAVVITDGLDDSPGGYGQAELRRKITDGFVPVYALGIRTRADGNMAQNEALKALGEISRLSGGEYAQASKETITEVLATLSTLMQQVDVATLDCSKCLRDGSTQRLQLAITTGSTSVSESRDVRLLSESLRPDGARVGQAGPTPPPPNAFETFYSETRNLYSQHPVERAVLLGCTAVLLCLSMWKLALRIKRRREQLASQHFGEPNWRDPLVLPSEFMPVQEASAAGNYEPSMTGGVTQSSYGKKVFIALAGQTKRDYSLGSDISIGRAQTNTLVISDDSLVSSRHAEITERQGVAILVDKGATNGTYLNGSRLVNPEPLSDGDVIVVGRTEIRVYFPS